MPIHLNFINRATQKLDKPPTVVLFQKGQREDLADAVIWKVIRHCRYEHFHPLMLSNTFEIGLGDAYDNYQLAHEHTDHPLATHGQAERKHARHAQNHEQHGHPRAERAEEDHVRHTDEPPAQPHARFDKQRRASHHKQVLMAHRGDHFVVEEHDGKPRLSRLHRQHGGGDIVVENKMVEEWVRPCLFSRGDLLAKHGPLAFEHKVAFDTNRLCIAVTKYNDDDHFDPNIPGEHRRWREGARVNLALIKPYTELYLGGLGGASIVMEPDGSGESFVLKDQLACG